MSVIKYGKIQKKTVALLTAVFLLVSCLNLSFASSLEGVQVRSAPLAVHSSAKNGMVRVYLASLGNPSTLDLTINGNYSLSTNGEFIANGTSLRVGFSSSSGNLTLTYQGQTMHMGRSFSLRRHNANGANGILIAQSRDSQNPYPGDLSFEAVFNGGSYTLYTIAHVYIENYLYGVLPYEMGNSSGMEALKAQAVAARTYTVRMMEKRASSRYDVKDTTSDQVYRGTPSGNGNCVAAVDATKGIVLMYGSEYITTYYSASNGGQTETSRTSSAYAYMKVKDDPFDYANPSSTVKKKTIYADLTSTANPSGLITLLENKAVQSLQKSGYPATLENTSLKTLRSVTPHTPMYASPSRLYTQMDFTFTVSTFNSAGLPALLTLTETCGIFTELEALLGLGIQSTQNELWSVEKGTNTFVIQARRYGHGMGMSQRGAMYMAKLGYTYDQILGFYYEGCNRVKHSFTNRILSASSSDQEITVEKPAELEQQDTVKYSGTITLVGNSTSVALRSSASNTSGLIGTVSNGALVEVLFQDGMWYQIRFGELVGYVPASAINVKGTPAQQKTESSNILGFSTVTANDFVNLRAGASMSAKVVATAPAGAILSVFSKSGSWAKVQYQAVSAYVNMNYISDVSDQYPSSDLSTGTRNAVIVTETGTSTVNLRKSASTNAQLVDRLPVGMNVTVLSDDGSWCRINSSSGEGYVLAEYLKYTEHEDAGPEETEPAPDDEETAEDAENESLPPTDLLAIVTTQAGTLNLRSQASPDAQILTTIPKGETVTVLAKGSSWSAVRYAGYDGYVMSIYLTFRSAAHETPEVSQKPGTEESGALKETALVSTNSGSLNMRSLPSLNSHILTTIPQYATVSVTAYGTGWCSVRYGNYEGYVMTRYLSFPAAELLPPESIQPEKPEEVQPGKDMWVKTASGSLNLRSEPDGNSQIVATIPRYAQVILLGSGTEWSSVSYGGHTGYVMTKYLSEEKPYQGDVPSAPATPEGVQKPDEPEEILQPFITIGGVTLDVTLETPYAVTFAEVTTNTTIFDMCSESGNCLFVVPAAEEVEILLKGRYWCRVDYQGEQGYCMTKFLNER